MLYVNYTTTKKTPKRVQPSPLFPELFYHPQQTLSLLNANSCSPASGRWELCPTFCLYESDDSGELV